MTAEQWAEVIHLVHSAGFRELHRKHRVKDHATFSFELGRGYATGAIVRELEEARDADPEAQGHE
jgi:hypothetical protein